MEAYDHFYNWANAVIKAAQLDVELQPTAERTMLAIYNALEIRKRDAIAAHEAEMQANVVINNQVVNNIPVAEVVPIQPNVVQPVQIVAPVPLPPAPQIDVQAYYQALQNSYIQANADAVARYNAQVEAERQRQNTIIAAQRVSNPSQASVVNVRLGGMRTLTILDAANPRNAIIDNEFANVLNGIQRDGKRISEPAEFTSRKLFGR